MSGTVRTIGYNRSSNGPDLAKVEANQQLVSLVQNPSPTSDFIGYSVKGYVGNWLAQASIRFGVWDAPSASGAPGALLARTVSVNPSVNYVDAAGGQERTLNLETPLVIRAGEFVALGIGSASNPAGVAMYQASAISQPNESFYRKGISGNNLESSGGEETNQGQLALALFGEANIAPNQPGAVSRSGTANRPTMTATFSDTNETLNNGVAYDELAAHRHVWAWGGSNKWDNTYAANATEKSQRRSIRQAPGTLPYDTPILYTVLHRDRLGEWSIARTLSFTVPNPNNAPAAPYGLTPTGNVVGTLTPVLSLIHHDPDGDSSSMAEVQVQTANGSATMWQHELPFVVGHHGRGNIGYGGSALSFGGIGYRWRARTRDTRGVQGPWSAWVNFVLLSGPSVDAPTSPSGRITNLANPGTVSAVYRNSGGVNGNAWAIGLFNANDVLIKQSPTFTTSFAPNSTLNAAWASTTFGSLKPGYEYFIAVTARDSSGQWSGWGAKTRIVANAAPNTPTLYGPNSDPRSALPGFSVRVTDPDQPPTDVTVTIEVYDATGSTLIGTGPAPQHPGMLIDGTVYSMFPAEQAAIVTNHGSYRWRAQASDGFLTSAWSDMWTLNYFPVPAVAITAPAGPVITTSQPVFEWVSTNQTAWRLQGYDGDRVVFDTGIRAGAAQSFALPAAQYWVGGERWNNLESFEWVVSVQDSSTLWGYSEARALTLEYIPPAVLTGVIAEPLALPFVAGTHYVAVQFEQTTYVEGEFLQCEMDRVEIDGPGGNEIPGTLRMNHAVDDNAATTLMVDFDLTSNQWYRWGVRQKIQAGSDVISSEPVYVEAMVSWHGTLLHMPFDPISNYVWLQYGAVGGSYEPTREHGMVMTSETDINGDVHNYIVGRPTVNPSGAYTFISKDPQTAMQQLDKLYRMFVYQNPKFSPDGRPHGLCWREGRGGLGGRQYVMLANWRDTGTIGGTQSVELEFIPNANGGAS